MKINCWKSLSVCLVAFSILFFVLPGFAQDSTLQVKCVDASGAPVAGVKIFVASLKAPQKPKDKKSDGQGAAEFTKLEDGAYRVYGRKEGMVPALYEFAVLKASQASATLKFEAGADKKLWFEDPVEEKNVAEIVAKGVAVAKQGNLPEAQKLLNDAIIQRPSYAEAYYYLGMALIQQKKYEEGIQALDKAAELSTIWLTAPPPGQNAYPQIIQQAQQTKKNLPAIRAMDQMNQKNYDAAVKAFNEAIQANPNEPELHANLAIALTNLQKFDDALPEVDKAIQMKPDQQSYADLKKNITARKDNAVIQKAQVILDEGTKLLNDGDAAGALKKFEEAKTMVKEGSQSPIWRQIGRAQAKLKQPEAEASFKKAVELVPVDKPQLVAEFKSALAQYYLESKRYEEALGLIANPKNEQELLGVAKTYGNKQPNLAEAALELVIKMNAENLDAAYDLAMMYYADGKEKDQRTKELLTLYTQKGKDPNKVDNAKGTLVGIARRNK